MLFSEKLKLAQQAIAWCEKHKVPPEPLNIVTALYKLDRLNICDHGCSVYTKFIDGKHIWHCCNCHDPIGEHVNENL